MDEYKRLKEAQIERLKGDSRNEIPQIDNSVTSLKAELTERKKRRNRRDCYSLMQEELSHNPFMTKIMKSSQFTPSAGVTHTDNVLLTNSPSVSGGVYQSPREGIMSKAEFELRTSLTVLKPIGPQEKNKRNRKVTQSMEIKP